MGKLGYFNNNVKLSFPSNIFFEESVKVGVILAAHDNLLSPCTGH